MSFSDPRMLWALLVLPPLMLLEWLAARRAARALRTLVGPRENHALLTQVPFRARTLGAMLRLLALAPLVIGAAGPEWGREVVRRGASGSDVVLLVDVSASMDVRDVPPSRLAEARREALAVLDRLGESRLAVVAFAGDAVRLCPLTLDRSAVRLSLEALSNASVSEPGSDLGKALRTALRVLPGGRREEQAIVMWSDGEDLEQGAKPAIEAVARTGIRVFAVGVGTARGDVVPVLDDQGRAIDIKRDDSGNAVRSRLDEPLLRLLARRTHGAYFASQRPGGELPRLVGALGSVARAARGQRLIERPVARFPWFAVVAALLLAWERVWARRRRAEPAGEQEEVSGSQENEPSGARARRPRASDSRSPRQVARAAVLVALASICLARSSSGQSAWARGDRAFKAGHFASAESLYTLRLRRGGPADVRVNRATAHAMRAPGEPAERELDQLSSRDDRAGRTAGYNLGTLLGERRQYPPALAALRRTLERDPADQDARWNYEVLLRRQQEERRQPQKPKPEPQPSQGGGSGTGAPQNQPAPTPPQPQSPGPPPPQQAPTPNSQGMSRAQAEQLLNALDELARAEQQRMRKVRVLKEKRGKDW